MTVTLDKNRVRLLISDIGGEDGESFLFTDSEIDTFLEMRGGSVFKAAATALRAIASNEALVSKRIEFLQLKTDGPAVAKELREQAAELETTADDDAEWDSATLVPQMNWIKGGW